ncbi:chemotaxis protein CheX [Candidatus Latescibacterota bacterium]
METILKNLKIAIFDVLEKMYFLLSDANDGSIPEISDSQNVYIGISGNPAYIITLMYDKSLAVNMTSDLLGLNSEDVDVETIQKCLKETSNIIAGNFLLGFNNEENRNITLPQIKKKDVLGECNTLNSNEFILSFNGCGINVILDEVDVI